MPFTVNDFRDLVALLEERPDWRAELRRLILPEEILRLPEVVRELADAVREMSEQMRRAEARLQKVESRLERVELHVGNLRGNDLERRVRERPHIYLGNYARRTRLISDRDLFAWLDQAVNAGRLARDQANDVERLDAVVEGQAQADEAKIYLAVEVSSTVDEHDFERAMRRAAMLQQALQAPVQPVVVGAVIPDELRLRIESAGGGWAVAS